jgi:transposase
MKITTVGLDLAKNVFHIIGLNAAGTVLVKKKLSRKKMKPYFANLSACVVAMEACSSAHYWGRELEKLGHRVKLIPPRFVKPYLQGSKNDYNDALAIAEAQSRPKLRFVTIKTQEQQDEQALHRLKAGVTSQRTQVCNQLRGLLAEYGLIVPTGITKLRTAIPEILEDGENGLSGCFRELLYQGYQQLLELDQHIKAYDKQLQQRVKANEAAQRLMSIPGFGPVVSSVFLSAIGDGKAFARGRDVSAYIGLVPRQHSSGDKQVLLGITKRGNKYLRALLVHGARSVVKNADKKDDKLSCWVSDLVKRRGKNKAIVALANKLARIGWSVLTSGGVYQVNRVSV